MATPYKTFSYHTFGCKVNFADSSHISRQLMNKGYHQVPFENDADIYLLNTCSVTEKADNKANRLIRKIHRKSPNSKIIVFGCYAQLKPDEILKIKGVSTVIGTEKKFQISDIISEDQLKQKKITSDIDGATKFDISYSLNERTRAFIKIQDGCNYNCSFCTIPMARGISRSLNSNNTVKVIKAITHQGINEVILSGINIGDFGTSYRENLEILLTKIEEIKSLKRYRISSIEPNLLSNKILKIISESNKALPHFHIPLQSGSDKILKLMKRRYSVEDYKKLILNVKKYIPNVCIGIDVIVGFPGESEQDFNYTYKILNDLDISYLHVFTYSERENTAAVKIFPKVNFETKILRRNSLRLLSQNKYKNFINKNIGRKTNILFEDYTKGILSGWTDNYIKVKVKGRKNLINKIKHIQILNSLNNTVNGVLINEA